MTEKSPHRYSGVHITHPGARDRERGATSKVWLGVARPSGTLLEVPLSEGELVKLIASASYLLAVLYKDRPS